MLILKNIKVGDFVEGHYKFGLVCGIVFSIKSKIVVIKKCKPYYNKYTLTNELLNLTKNRIYRIGLNQNEVIITE